jgi:polar amino acid transport system substrate-binding protein
VRKDWPLAVSILDKGLAALGEDERAAIQGRWFLAPLGVDSPASVVLSPDERAFLDRLGPLRLCVDPDWMPFESVGADGRNQGIVADLVGLVIGRLGHSVELVRTSTWSETLTAAEAGVCDIVSGLAITPERSRYLDFTRPLLTEPLVVAVKSHTDYDGDPLSQPGRTFLMVRGHAAIELMRRAYPAVQIRETPDIVTGLRAVERGEAFGFVDLLPSIAWTAQRRGILDVKVAGDLPLHYELAVGVRKGIPLVRSSLSKAVASLTPAEIKAVRDRWISVRYEQPADVRWLMPWLGGGGVVLLAVLLWNLRLRQLNAALRRANGEIARLTVTDELTGLYNRRRFLEVMEREWRRAWREGTSLHLLMVDIDHFKNYNDHYGHPEGDSVLQRIGALLRAEAKRGGDFAFRIGGEEFALLLADSNETDARRVAEHLLEASLQSAIPHAASPVAPVVTLSLGLLSVLPARSSDRPPLPDWREVYRRADRLLYDAKREGRNRLVTARWAPDGTSAAPEKGFEPEVPSDELIVSNLR